MKYLVTYIIGLVFGILISAIFILYFVEIKNIFLTNSLTETNITEHFKDNYYPYESKQLNILDIEDQKDIDNKKMLKLFPDIKLKNLHEGISEIYNKKFLNYE